MTDKESGVRETARTLWRSLDVSVGKESGLAIDRAALRASFEVEQDIKILPNTRKSAEGRPLDFLAPSVWHAACFLIGSYVVSRLNHSRFSDDSDLFDSFYGNRPVFRGQARPWNITPSAWRNNYNSALRRRREIFRDLLTTVTGDQDAIEFELFGKIRSLQQSDALAQHYGMPTNLVDFTFDPRVAISFACHETPYVEVEHYSDKWAVVYFISFRILCLTGTPTLTFPPVQAERLYRQSGFFVDYGERPENIGAELSFENPWMWVQQNCGRLFFPRAYPGAAEFQAVKDISPDLLLPEAFFEESIAKIELLDENELAGDNGSIVDALREKLGVRPPWRVRELDHSYIYTDDELLRIGKQIERYVRIASILEMDREPYLDPIILWKLVEFDAQAISAIKALTDLPYGRGEELRWILQKIKESVKAVADYRAREESATNQT